MGTGVSTWAVWPPPEASTASTDQGQDGGRALGVLPTGSQEGRGGGSGLGVLRDHRINSAHLLTEGTGPFQVAPQRGLLQLPPNLGLASSLSHSDAPGLARWPLGREESLTLPHCAELGCRAEGVCPRPPMPRAPIDGRIAGE